MNTQWLIPVASAVAVFLFLTAIAVVYGLRIRRTQKTTWEDLMHRIAPVDRKGIETIALRTVNASGQPIPDEARRELERHDIWTLLGGMDGIARIEGNSRVLIEIAAYLERWHTEAADTAEELRQEAKKLEWHVSRLRAAEENHCLDQHFHFYGRSAAVSYYLMSTQLLDLYRRSHSALFGELQKAL